MNKKAEKTSVANSLTGTAKIGLNGVTLINKPVSKDQTMNRGSKHQGRSGGMYGSLYDGKMNDIDEVFGVNTIPDDSDTSYKSAILTRLTRSSHCTTSDKISVGTLVGLLEDTGCVVTTRYCNYNSSDISLQTGNIFEQVHCAMIYIDTLEILLPSYPGDLLTCAAEVVYTTNHCLEVKALIWAEDLVSSGKRLICKACLWYAAYSVEQNWRPAGVPKLNTLELRQDRDGLTKFEAYKDDRRAINTAPIKQRGVSAALNSEPQSAAVAPHTPKYSETVLTHMATIHDCGAHLVMNCGNTVQCMNQCAELTAAKHSGAEMVATACFYKLHFLESIPKGSLLIICGRVSFTSKKLMEIEVVVDLEMASDQSIQYRRVSVGYFIVVAVNENERILNIPNVKLTNPEEEARYMEGQRRFDQQRRHLIHTENQLAVASVTNKDMTSSSYAAPHSTQPNIQRVALPLKSDFRTQQLN